MDDLKKQTHGHSRGRLVTYMPTIRVASLMGAHFYIKCCTHSVHLILMISPQDTNISILILHVKKQKLRKELKLFN